MSQAIPEMLLKHNLKTLRLPTILAEYSKLSREAADPDEAYDQYLLRLTELEVAIRPPAAMDAKASNSGRSVQNRLHEPQRIPKFSIECFSIRNSIAKRTAERAP